MKNLLKNKVSKPINQFLILLALFLLLILVIIRRWLPINTLVAYFDDGLFMSRAEFIMSGNLGEINWGFNALVKGTFYPWFIVLGNMLNSNPIFLSYLILILIITLLGLIVFYITKNVIIPLLLIIFVVADPVYFSEGAGRVMRELPQQNLVLLFFVLYNLIFYSMKKSQSRNSKYFLILLSVTSGLILALAINVREENIWIYSAYALNVLILLLSRKFNSLQIVYVNALIIATLFISIQAVKAINNRFYEVLVQNSTTEGEFPKMMLNLSSIKTSEGNIRYSAIDKAKRKIAYEVSPSFAELKDYLEGPGQAWVQFGCQDSNVCDDYSNGWFHVALRVAMREIGWWETEKIAQEKMRQINLEISNACDEKLITCTKGIPFGPAYGNQFISKQEIVDSVPYFSQYVTASLNNWGTQRQVGSSTIFKTEIMPEDLYTSWKQTIPNLPFGQNQYIDKYNSRYLILQPYLNLWSGLYSILLKIMLTINLLVPILILYYKSRLKINIYLISTYLVFLYLWVSRGVFLSLNSSVNFKSVSITYALSGRVFLTCFLVLGIIIIFKILKQKSTSLEHRAD
jgi:hypothetical protein